MSSSVKLKREGNWGMQSLVTMAALDSGIIIGGVDRPPPPPRRGSGRLSCHNVTRAQKQMYTCTTILFRAASDVLPKIPATLTSELSPSVVCRFRLSSLVCHLSSVVCRFQDGAVRRHRQRGPAMAVGQPDQPPVHSRPVPCRCTACSNTHDNRLSGKYTFGHRHASCHNHDRYNNNIVINNNRTKMRSELVIWSFLAYLYT